MVKESSVNLLKLIDIYWQNLWLQVVQKENQMPLISKQVEEIVELAHQIRGDDFDYMMRDDVETNKISRE